MQIHKIETTKNNNRNYFTNVNNNQSQLVQNNKSNRDEFLHSGQDINFKGGHYKGVFYSDDEIRLAKKYLHVSDFTSVLRRELWERKSGWDRFWGDYYDDTRYTVGEVTRLIGVFKEEIAENARKAKELAERIKQQEEAAAAARRLEQATQARIQRERIEAERRSAELAQEALKQKKLLQQQQRISQVQDVLTDRFVNLAKMEQSDTSRIGSISFPNGIMVIGAKKQEMKKIINWVSQQSNTKLEEIDFSKLEQSDVLSRINVIAQNAQEHYNTTNQRTIIYINSFDRYTTPTDDNHTFIGKLKAFLSSCSDKCKCTVITDIEKPEKLAPEVTAAHRFQAKIKMSE